MSLTITKSLSKSEPVRFKQKYIDQILQNEMLKEKLSIVNGISPHTTRTWLLTNSSRLTQLQNINIIGESLDLSQDIDWFEELLENVY